MARDILKLTPNQKAVLRFFLLLPPGKEAGTVMVHRAIATTVTMSSTSARCQALAKRGFLLERMTTGYRWQRGPLCDMLEEQGLDAAILDGQW